jgi:hypothetical protein
MAYVISLQIWKRIPFTGKSIQIHKFSHNPVPYFEAYNLRDSFPKSLTTGRAKYLPKDERAE